MTTPHDPHSTPDDPTSRDAAPLDAAREQAVRRLLAEAGGPEAVPEEVAARLDATLADLVAERSEGADPATTPVIAPVTDLAARRRRRLMRGVLGAAAAVVVIGLGLQFTDDTIGDGVSSLADGDPDRGNDAAGAIESGDGSGDTQDDTTSESQLDEFAEADAGDQSQRSGPTNEDQAPRSSLAEAKRRTVDEPVRVIRDAHLRDDLVALQDRGLPAPATADYSGVVVTAPPGFACAEMELGPGIYVAARYRGEPALVGFREPVGSTQVADVVRCGTGDILRSMTLPAP
ncbi:hypothetical protein FXB39_02640 [Nocardioides sp. BGMRC 2183]|nr:hypothetical protein FXB39_02640 [Nocardioides sp. BGMRC 2183]